MKSYDAVITREGRWWMIEIPELDGLTQARRLDEVEQVAREYSAVTTDVPFSQVAVEISGIEVAGQDLLEAKALVDGLRTRAKELEALVADLSRQVASALSDANVPVRDVSTVLGVSHQRVSQLVQAAAETDSSDLTKLVRAARGEYAPDLVVRLENGRSLQILEVASPEEAKGSKTSRPGRAATQRSDHPTRRSAKSRRSRVADRSGVAGRPRSTKQNVNNS